MRTLLFGSPSFRIPTSSTHFQVPCLSAARGFYWLQGSWIGVCESFTKSVWVRLAGPPPLFRSFRCIWRRHSFLSRLHSSSFLGLPSRIPHLNQAQESSRAKKGTKRCTGPDLFESSRTGHRHRCTSGLQGALSFNAHSPGV